MSSNRPTVTSSNRPTVTVTFPDRFGGSHVRSDDLVWSVGWVDAGTYELVPADLRHRIEGLRIPIPDDGGRYLMDYGYNEALDDVLAILEERDE